MIIQGDKQMNRKLDRAMRFLKCLIVLVLLMSTCFISVSKVSATGSIYNTSNDIAFSKKRYKWSA